nr:putative nuclease HARBI1 [Misgurnus anguillicaudatus]
MSDETIVKKFRLPREQILQLLDLVGPELSRQTRRSYPLSPEIQLLAALRFYAVGSFLEVVGDGYGLSKTSVWLCVHSVTNVLLRHATDYIRMPFTMHEVMETHQGFHAIAGIPRVIGLVDGTLIPISNPSALDQAFICRKGFAAINVQVVVDHRGVITDIVAKWPGSTHDSFVWANSAVGQDAERRVFGESIFLGDSGYPLRTYLLNPVTNPTTQAEHSYNAAHARTRNLVERSIGRWKMRFRCLHKSAGGLRLKPQRCCAVVVATAMLHNIAVTGGAALPEEVDEEEEEEAGFHNPPELRDALHAAGVQTRNQMIHSIFG